jgi:hypothetical protein
LLQLTLLLRLVADMADLPNLRRWSGLLNAATILLFMINTLLSLRFRVTAPVAAGTSRQ